MIIFYLHRERLDGGAGRAVNGGMLEYGKGPHAHCTCEFMRMEGGVRRSERDIRKSSRQVCGQETGETSSGVEERSRGAWKGAAAISDSSIFLFDLRAALESEEKKTGFFGFISRFYL